MSSLYLPRGFTLYNKSGFERYFNEELTFHHFTSNIIRVSIYMNIFGLNNLHDYKNYCLFEIWASSKLFAGQ